MRNNKKLLAYYLPAFYPTPENDKWWGKGFTEWNHVRSARTLFKEHQAMECKPHPDIGYYEMSLDTLRKQQAMAKQYGVDGFALYHYWFEGKQMLDMPFNLIMENKDLDLPFCLMWANENWTRNWDGKENEVLLHQNYSEDDCRNFIRSLLPALTDERYIKVDNKPLLMLYNAEPQWVERMAEIWRGECGFELFLIHRTSAGLGDQFHEDVRLYNGWDGVFDFVPRNMNLDKLNSNDSFHVYDYQSAIHNSLSRKECPHRFFHSVMPSWDNSPRMGENSHIVHRSSPELFNYWLDEMTKKTKEDIVFINAWNEWGEMAVLEPSEVLGYRNLEALTI